MKMPAISSPASRSIGPRRSRLDLDPPTAFDLTPLERGQQRTIGSFDLGSTNLQLGRQPGLLRIQSRNGVVPSALFAIDGINCRAAGPDTLGKEAMIVTSL